MSATQPPADAVMAVARAIATALWGEFIAQHYFDPRYDASPDVRRGEALDAARAAIATLRPAIIAEERAKVQALEAELAGVRTGLQAVAGNILNIQIGLDTGDTKAIAARRLSETVNLARAILHRGEVGGSPSG